MNEPKDTPLHHHPCDGGYYPECARCKLNFAAPELLEACRMALRCSNATLADLLGDGWDEDSACVVAERLLNDTLSKAIAKAEGRGE